MTSPATDSRVAVRDFRPLPSALHPPPSRLRVQELNPLQDPQWDALVQSLAGGTFFHTSAWARVLCATYGFRPRYLACFDGDRLRGALPLMEVTSCITGRRGVALPFSDECEPLVADQAILARLWQHARHLAAARGWKYVEVRGGERLTADQRESCVFLRHRLRLEEGPERLWNRFASSTRRAIRKAERLDLQVEFSRELGPLREFYGLLGQTRRRHGLPPQPFQFFRQIHRHVLAAGKGTVVLARNAGRAIAGAVYFFERDTALYKFGASDSSYQHLRANNLVMWSAIRAFAAEGLVWLHFGRTALDHEGLRRFKLGWGATEEPIGYFSYNLKRDAFIESPAATSRLSATVFRVLPPGLSRLIGALMYKHVA